MSQNLQGFATIPRAVLHDRSIPAAAKMVYVVLSSYVGQNDTAWPSHATIADDAGLSVATVKRQLKVLRERGLVRWTHHIAPGTECRTINTYELIAATPTPQQLPIAQSDPTFNLTLGSERAIEDSGWVNLNLGSQGATNEQRTKKTPTESSARTRKRTDRDDLWDAVAAACGVTTSELPKSTRAAFGRVVNELHEVGAIPGQVKVRAARYRQRYEGRAALTPTALLKHWAALGEQFQPPETPSRGAEVHDFPAIREQQRAEAAARLETANESWMRRGGAGR